MNNRKLLHHPQIIICLVFFVCLFSPHGSTYAQAASDSAKVISSTSHHGLTTANAKPIVVALLNMDEILPECQQHIIKTTIQGVHYSESGISIDSIRFNWFGTKLEVPTNIGEDAIFTIDDIRNANKFIQVGKGYLIHFQQCGNGSRRSLVNIYAQPPILPASPVSDHALSPKQSKSG